MIHTIAGNGKSGFSGDGDLATNAQFNYSKGIATSPNGDLYIADSSNNRIRKVAPNSLISTIAGSGQKGFSGDGDLSTNAQLYYPQGISISSSGDLYIADTHNNRIRKVAPNGHISTVAGNGQKGFSGDGGLATNAGLSTPCGIAAGSNGELYIADTYNHRIRKVTPDGHISTVAGNGTNGLSGDGGSATNAQLNRPYSIAISPSGELYIADTHNHRIRKVASNGSISTIAGNGKPGFSGDGGSVANTQLNFPYSIAVDSNGEIYIADTHNHRIRKVAPNGSISTIAGNGSQGFSGDDGLATNAKLHCPCGVAVGTNGEVYIVDIMNSRIRKIVGLSTDDSIRGVALRKYERDHVLDSIVCFRPLLGELSPNFESILNADTLLMLDMNERLIVQQLIDSLMYGGKLDSDPKNDNVVDWLFVLGMIEGNEFLEVKTRLLFQFMSQIKPESIAVVLEKLITLKKRDIRNQLLGSMIEYTLGMAALALRDSPDLATNPIIEKHLVRIAQKFHLTKLAPITLDEEADTVKIGDISSLFNHMETSDIKILLGERVLHCHCTILSSYSSYFEALFNNNCSFNDLEDGTYRIDCTEFGEELHEMAIKFCYGLFGGRDISDEMAVPLFKCASFYGIAQLVDSTVAAIEISSDSYFELVDQLGHYPCETLCARLVEFGFANLKSLGMTQEKLASLPEQIKEQLFWKCIQEQVRK